MAQVKAILVPASELRKATIVPLDTDNWHAQISGHVHGLPDRGHYDFDAAMYVNGQGHDLGFPLNARATEYMRTESEAGKRGNFRRSDFFLAGNVVIVGESDHGGGDIEIVDVPDRLIAHFIGAERDHGAEPV